MEQREDRGSTKEMDVVELYTCCSSERFCCFACSSEVHCEYYHNSIVTPSSSMVDMAAPTVKRRVLQGQIPTFIVTGHTPSIALLGLTLE